MSRHLRSVAFGGLQFKCSGSSSKSYDCIGDESHLVRSTNWYHHPPRTRAHPYELYHQFQKERDANPGFGDRWPCLSRTSACGSGPCRSKRFQICSRRCIDPIATISHT